VGSPLLKGFCQARDHEQAGVSGRVRPKTPAFLPALNCFDDVPDGFEPHFLAKRLYVLPNPFKDLRDGKLAPIHQTIDEFGAGPPIPTNNVGALPLFAFFAYRAGATFPIWNRISRPTAFLLTSHFNLR
jgi:hypothetical protein